LGGDGFSGLKGVLPKPEISDFKFQISESMPEADDIRNELNRKKGGFYWRLWISQEVEGRR